MVENITKLEAAKRQLKEAIWLFFHERDAISIHTLTAAAHQVLHDIAQREGIMDIKNYPFIREEKRAYWISRLNEAQNFFKHADRDCEATLEFRPALTQFLLFDAQRLYLELTQSSFDEALIYVLWFARKYPDLYKESEFKTLVSTADFDPEDFEFQRVALAVLRVRNGPDSGN